MSVFKKSIIDTLISEDKIEFHKAIGLIKDEFITMSEKDNKYYKEPKSQENIWIPYGRAWYLVSFKYGELSLSVKNGPDEPILNIRSMGE